MHVLAVLSVTITTTGLYLINDVFDLEIDKISHPERALPQGLVSTSQASAAAVLMMVCGITFAFWINPTSGFLVATIALFGILYSVPPVRLRKFPVVPSAIIGLFVFLSFLSGTFFWYGPITGKLVFGGLWLWAMFLCCSMAKDLGDIEGDKVDGVQSLPLIVNEELAFKITSTIVCSAFLFPIIFILLFGLHLAFIAPILVFLVLEAYCQTKMYRTRGTTKFVRWFELGFLQFVGTQITLMVGAFL